MKTFPDYEISLKLVIINTYSCWCHTALAVRWTKSRDIGRSINHQYKHLPAPIRGPEHVLQVPPTALCSEQHWTGYDKESERAGCRAVRRSWSTSWDVSSDLVFLSLTHPLLTANLFLVAGQKVLPVAVQTNKIFQKWFNDSISINLLIQNCFKLSTI